MRFISLFLLLAFFAWVPGARADTCGPRTAGTVSTSSATAPWVDENWVAVDFVSEIATSDNDYVEITAGTFDTGTFSFRLLLSNWGCSIPTDATINGVELVIERSGTSGDVEDDLIRWTTGDNKAAVGAWPVTDTDATYGGPGDGWGASFTPGDFNDNPGRTLEFAVEAIGNNADAFVDFLRITVTYTPAAGGGGGSKRLMMGVGQ